MQEWCEKQVEFSITQGKPQKTEAMKAGSARHVELEIEVRNFYFLQFVKQCTFSLMGIGYRVYSIHKGFLCAGGNQSGGASTI